MLSSPRSSAPVLWRAVFERLNENDPTPDEAVAELYSARSALARTVPTTPAGLAALTAFLREAQANLHGAAPYFDDGADAVAFSVSLDTAVRGMGPGRGHPPPRWPWRRTPK